MRAFTPSDTVAVGLAATDVLDVDVQVDDPPLGAVHVVPGMETVSPGA